MDKDTFFALVVDQQQDASFARTVRVRSMADLPPGEVLIRVHYSSLNYKDALSATGNQGVTKNYPHTPGIDAAGTVADSTDPRWRPGDEVICTGYDLGMNTAGGFGQYIRVPGSWVVSRPASLTLRESMELGTAGFTAALSVAALANNGVGPTKGPILVTGATGGVGSIALILLHQLGYQAVAVTGKPASHPWLQSLGASAILGRDEFLADKDKGLLPVRWGGVIDTVGGEMLATAIKGVDYDGVVTSCGNAASADLPLNVYPFILRGVHLVGIYSANCPMARRLAIWERLAGDWKPDHLARICRVVFLNQLEEEIMAMIAGKSKGRCVVDLEARA